MIIAPTVRHPHAVVYWTLIWMFAVVLVFAVMTRVAGANGPPAETQPAPVTVVSPFSGTFVAGPYRGSEPYVSAGDEIEQGDLVGHVEVCGRLTPIYSLLRGTVLKVLIQDGAVVEVGQPLFEVRLEVLDLTMEE